ncbi:hypothetical protein C446_16150 [Halobiforma nitratireducens JCM 10879]|uniref:Molybdopterin cofactor biosynthesis MoaD-related C-terminal domain-containing protein n=2 Tax=Halobiforma nitratireducens TaxID=130048 RepID=M0LDA3_9EURY|nr:hypothetical protein C446_16150 [Halobiforma nitratireducens JCM 10879]
MTDSSPGRALRPVGYDRDRIGPAGGRRAVVLTAGIDRVANEFTLGDPTPGMTTRVERSFRGISERLVVRYLTNLGGKRVAEDTVEDEDGEWKATFSSDTVEIGPSLTLTEITIVFEGEKEPLESLIDDFARKAMRAGG